MRRLRKGARRLLHMSVVGAVVAGVSGCGNELPTVELPAEWVDMATESSSVVFRPDDSGTFAAFPLRNGASCDVESAVPYTGEFRWRAVDGYFQVAAPNGPMDFKADTGVMGDLHWGKMMVRICGEDTPKGESIVYLGDFLGD